MMNFVYDENRQLGNDYFNFDKAAEWDLSIGRTPAIEDLKHLQLKRDDVLLDIGCGSGYHIIPAAKICRHVHGVDISKAMLKIARTRIKQENLSNVTLHNAGFLVFNGKDLGITATFSWGALHHLPDVWKAEALHRIAKILAPGGKFLLMDLAFSFRIEKRHIYQAKFIEEVRSSQGNQMAQDIIKTFQNEFVTYRWILKRLLREVGFDILSSESLSSKCWTNFLCIRRGE